MPKFKIQSLPLRNWMFYLRKLSNQKSGETWEFVPDSGATPKVQTYRSRRASTVKSNQEGDYLSNVFQIKHNVLLFLDA